MTIQTMNGFNLDVSRVDALEHDKRGRGIVPVAVDKVRGELSRRSMSDAVSINRSRLYLALTDMFNTKLGELITILYERDALGLVNVDSISGRVLCGVPWGSKKHTAWGLRATEADTMRRLMMNRQLIQNHIPLLVYDPDQRKWYLNFHDYQTVDQALTYCNDNPFHPAGVRSVWRTSIDKRNGSYKTR